MVALRSDRSPITRPASMARTKADMVPSVVAIRNGGLFSSENGRFGHDAEQQRRQRNIEQEEIHPGEAGFRQPLGLAAGKTDEDQAEIGNRKVKNIGHAGKVFSSAFSGRWRRIRQPDLRVNSTFCP